MCLCVALLKELTSTFQRLTVELTSNTSLFLYLRASTALESNCLTSIFYQPSLKKLWRSLRTVQARGVWFGCVVCDPSLCLGSHWASFVHSYFSSFWPFISFSWTQRWADENDSPPRETESKKKTDFPSTHTSSEPSVPFISANCLVKYLRCFTCVVFTLISYFGVNLETCECEWWKQLL